MENIIHYNNLGDIVAEEFKKSQKEILIFSPYITTNALKKILDPVSSGVHVSIITTWKVQDIAYGASELASYEFAKKRGFQFFLNQQIHLKTYLSDHKKVITGSANLTNNGMGFSSNPNKETLVETDCCPGDYLHYLLSILRDSKLVDDEIFAYFKEKSQEIKIDKISDSVQENIDKDAFKEKKDSFLVSELPMSSSVEVIYEIIKEQKICSMIRTKYCAFHDLAKYNISYNELTSMDDFKKKNASKFL